MPPTICQQLQNQLQAAKDKLLNDQLSANDLNQSISLAKAGLINDDPGFPNDWTVLSCTQQAYILAQQGKNDLASRYSALAVMLATAATWVATLATDQFTIDGIIAQLQQNRCPGYGS